MRNECKNNIFVELNWRKKSTTKTNKNKKNKKKKFTSTWCPDQIFTYFSCRIHSILHFLCIVLPLSQYNETRTLFVLFFLHHPRHLANWFIHSHRSHTVSRDEKIYGRTMKTERKCENFQHKHAMDSSEFEYVFFIQIESNVIFGATAWWKWIE